MNCQILFLGKIRKLFKNVICWKFCLECQVLRVESKYLDTLRGLNTFGVFSAIHHKGDNFCDLIFAFLHTHFLLNRTLCFLIDLICYQIMFRKNVIRLPLTTTPPPPPHPRIMHTPTLSPPPPTSLFQKLDAQSLLYMLNKFLICNLNPNCIGGDSTSYECTDTWMHGQTSGITWSLIALHKVFFFNLKYSYFSYFSLKTYVVGTH